MSTEMNVEKALGHLSESVSGVGGKALTTTRPVVAEKQINQTQNENVDGERNINSKSSLKKSLVGWSLEEQQGASCVVLESSGDGDEEKKSSVAKAEKSFSGKSRITTSSASQQTAGATDEAVKENDGESKRVETSSISVEAAATPEKALLRDKARAAAPSVSVELSKRSVGDKCSPKGDGVGESSEAATTAIEDKVLITTSTGDKYRYAVVLPQLVLCFVATKFCGHWWYSLAPVILLWCKVEEDD